MVLIALFSSYLSNRQGQNIGVSESVANGVDNFINTATVLSNAGKKEVGSSVGGDKVIENISTTIERDNKKQINNISVTFVLQDKKILAGVLDGSSVYDLMQMLQKKGDLVFKSTAYSGLGDFVEEINGIKNDNQVGKYWIYYVNGHSATIGVSNYILKNLDNIEWKYEKSKF